MGPQDEVILREERGERDIDAVFPERRADSET